PRRPGCGRAGRPAPPPSTAGSRRSGGVAPGSGPVAPTWPSPTGGARTLTRLGRRSTPAVGGPSFYAGPLRFHPRSDGVVVAFHGPAGRALTGPAQPVAQ